MSNNGAISFFCFIRPNYSALVKLALINVTLATLCEKCFQAYADSEGPDQTAHPRSLIRAFTVRL